MEKQHQNSNGNGVMNGNGVHKELSETQTYKNKQFPTIVQIKAALPNRLFEANLLLSLYFVVKDAVLIFSLFIGIKVLEWLLPPYLHIVALLLYWYLQGTMFMAVFVVGHDCGHGSFSKYDLVNDTLGTLLHTFVLTPYYPWKVSHKNHHKNTGNIDKDEVFYPIRQKYDNNNSFLYLFGLGLGWFVYLWRGYHPRNVNHFNPLETLFGSHVSGCTISIASIMAWSYGLYYYASVVGVAAFVKYYFVPELIFGTWLLIVTFLHHIEEDTPWYSDDNWNYVRGQLSSVDRHYGWAHDIIHNIGTHQIHHLFSKIPHYNLEEGTRHFRNSFPHLERSCDKSILPSMVRMYNKFSKQCMISNDAEIHVYK